MPNFDELKILNRKPDETDLEFICRVASVKSDYSMTWDDVASVCNRELGLHFGESYYRKKYSKTLLDTLTDETVPETDEPDYYQETAPIMSVEEFNALSAQEQADLYQSVSQKLKLINSERVRVADERNYNNLVLRRISREDSIKSIAIEMAKEMSKEKILSSPAELKIDYQDSTKVGILCISDWHYGIMIDNYWNKYNPEIAKTRIQKLLNSTLTKCAKENVSELYVVNLGDMIAGRIHAQIRIQSRYDVISQIINVTEILAEFLATLSNSLTKVYYYSCWDNHSRIEPNKKESLDLETLARITPWYLKERLASFENIEINDNRFGMNIISFNCLGHHIGGVHGDKDKPNRVVENITLYTQEKFDMILAAHLHHFSCDEKNETLVVSNGSLMGTDDFAESLRVNSKPSQNFIVVSEDNVAEEIHRIILD